MTWLTNWNYRKAITISNSGSTLTDYQTLVTIDTAALVTVGKLLSNCDDIRFTNSDGSTPINHWIESGINTSSTKIWIKIPSISTGSNTIYLYYGNSSATSTSNGDNTFVFFDDFNDNSIDSSKWDIGSGGRVTETASSVVEIVPDSNSWTFYLQSKSTFSYNQVIQSRIKTSNVGSGYWDGMLRYGNINVTSDWEIATRSGNYNLIYNRSTGSNPTAEQTIKSGIANNTYYIVKLIPTSSGVTACVDSTCISRTDEVHNNKVIAIQGISNGTTSTFDHIFVRKYTSLEPTTCIGGEEISTVSWLTGWDRRKLMTVTGSTNDQTDYQMQITVHKSIGTDTSTDIYLGTNVKDDFSDIRFTSSDGSTLLNYWIESYTSGSLATIWIKIPSVPTSPCTTTIYTYYNNSSATSTSSGTSTFDFFDDFLGSTLDGSKWWSGAVSTQYGTGSVTVSNSIATLTGGTNTWWGMFASGSTFYTPPFTVELLFSGANGPHAGISINGSLNPAPKDSAGFWYDANSYGSCNNYTCSSEGTTPSISSWSLLRIDVYSGGVKYFVNRSLVYTKTTNVPDEGMKVYMAAAHPSGKAYTDWVFIRKYASPEPTFSTISTEQTQTGDVSFTSTPAGATMYVDDVIQVGVTPSIITGLIPGSHTYKLTLSGYVDATGSFTITSGSTTPISVTLVTPANITATNVVITKSTTPCITGSCTLTIDVTWTNSGGTAGSIIPNIKIDNIEQIPKVSTSIPASSSITETWIITGMSAGTHTVCPHPN